MNSKENEHACSLRIDNPLGFHVRPVQRFAELAQIFDSEITVEIDGREADGKSVMGLMSLGGRCGSSMKIVTRGNDSRQALEVIRYLVEEDFFVEDDLDEDGSSRRHIERLKKFASCFVSEINILMDGEEIELKTPEDFDSLDFPPDKEVVISASGEDERQAGQVLEKLVKYRFYVEDAMDAASE